MTEVVGIIISPEQQNFLAHSPDGSTNAKKITKFLFK